MKTAFENLSWSVRALAQSAEVQKKLFPWFVVIAEELALTFDDYYRPALAQLRERWSVQQLHSLRVLDEKLSAMSGLGKEELWLTDDCLSHPEWSLVRSLAQMVVTAFDWPTDVPPPSDASYVQAYK